MRRGFLAPVQEGWLDGSFAALKVAARVTGEQHSNLPAIFFASVYQAGIDQFLLFEHGGKKEEIPPFVRERTRYVGLEKIVSYKKSTRPLFSAYLPEGWENSEQYDPVVRLSFFLDQLLDCMELGSSMLTMSGFPDARRLEGLLPLDLAIPINILLQSISVQSVAGPMPTSVVRADDVERFADLMTGELFGNYVRAQEIAEDANTPIAKGLASVVSAARKLVRQNKKLLRTEAATVGLLQATPKLIDAAFGKFPGAISEIATKLGLSYLESRRRIVIYDYGAGLRELMKAELRRMIIGSNEDFKTLEVRFEQILSELEAPSSKASTKPRQGK